MELEYFETHFKSLTFTPTVTRQFAIITAYATTGEVWTDEKNREANCKLKQQLIDEGLTHFPITGYSPKTGHAEPGFGVVVALPEAIALGRQFKQDAIYYVEGNKLSVHSCMNEASAFVGDFCERFSV